MKHVDARRLVVVDECHQVAADTFEAAIKNIAARRWMTSTLEGFSCDPDRTGASTGL